MRHDRTTPYDARGTEPWRDAHTMVAACGVTAAVGVSVGVLPIVLDRHPQLSDPAVLLSTLLLGLVVAALVRRCALHALRQVDSEREDLEAALIDARRARALREARAEEVEHDACSALGALRSALSTLDRYADELDRERAHRLQVAALHEVDHLEQLIRQQGPTQEDLDLGEVVAAVALTRRAGGLDVRVEGVTGRAVGSPQALATVLGNLLANAARHAPGARVEISSVVRGERVELRVRDDGPGMCAEMAAHAFERGTHRDHRLSSGLGLFTARRLVQEQGGELHLEPSPTGCSFVIVLDRAVTTPPSLDRVHELDEVDEPPGDVTVRAG